MHTPRAIREQMSLGRHMGRGYERERIVAEVLLGAIDTPSDSNLLVADDAYQFVFEGLHTRINSVSQYWRVANESHGAAAWPSDGPYDAATLRLSKDKGAFEMALHALASVLKPGAPLWVYGANDEGIKSAGKKLSSLFHGVETIDTRRHCRVIRAFRKDVPDEFRPTLADWVQELSLDHQHGPTPHCVYPGIFAKGQLDPATKLLLEAIPDPTPKCRVLDYGCGAGVIGAELLRRQPTIDLMLVDADAVAIVATQENVPNATTRIEANPLKLSDAAPFDLIVSNPPIHDGKERDYLTVKRLVEAAARYLNPGAPLWLVTQKQVPIVEHLNTHLAGALCVQSDGRFNVWRAVRS